MDKNKFKIDVVSEIPVNKTAGYIYINGTKYANVIPEDAPEKYLLVGSVTDTGYLGLGVQKDVVACVRVDESNNMVVYQDAPSLPYVEAFADYLKTKKIECVSLFYEDLDDDGFGINQDKIYVTPKHPGFYIPIPEDSTRFYLDSSAYKLYKPVENPRINGFKELKYLKEQAVVYTDTPLSPHIYAYADYEDTEEIEGVIVIYEPLVTDGENKFDQYVWERRTPMNVIVVQNEDELHALEPGFMGVYKVEHPDGTYTAYVYNPYELVCQEYFNFNCDVLY